MREVIRLDEATLFLEQQDVGSSYPMRPPLTLNLFVPTLVPIIEKLQLSMFPLTPLTSSPPLKLDQTLLPAPGPIDIRSLTHLKPIPSNGNEETSAPFLPSGLSDDPISSTLFSCSSFQASKFSAWSELANLCPQALLLPAQSSSFAHVFDQLVWSDDQAIFWFDALRRWFPAQRTDTLEEIFALSGMLLNKDLVKPHQLFVEYIFTDCFEAIVEREHTVSATLPGQLPSSIRRLIRLISLYTPLRTLPPESLKEVLQSLNCHPEVKNRLAIDLMSLSCGP